MVPPGSTRTLDRRRARSGRRSGAGGDRRDHRTTLTMTTLTLTKHHGLGNDFLVLLDPDVADRPSISPRWRGACAIAAAGSARTACSSADAAPTARRGPDDAVQRRRLPGRDERQRHPLLRPGARRRTGRPRRRSSILTDAGDRTVDDRRHRRARHDRRHGRHGRGRPHRRARGLGRRSAATRIAP